MENKKLFEITAAYALTCKTEHQREHYNTYLTYKYSH